MKKQENNRLFEQSVGITIISYICIFIVTNYKTFLIDNEMVILAATFGILYYIWQTTEKRIKEKENKEITGENNNDDRRHTKLDTRTTNNRNNKQLPNNK